MVKQSVLLPFVVGAFIGGFALGVFWTNVAALAHEEVKTHTSSPAELTFSRSAPHLSADERLGIVERRVASLEATSKASRGVAAAGGTGGVGAAAAEARGAAPTAAAWLRELGSRPSQRAGAAASLEGGCSGERKPYHVLVTAQDSLYQAWQTRIMYYHYLKQKKADPCGEMGGFTRMLNSPTGAGDALMSEMPTVIVEQLAPGDGCRAGGNTCDFGFPVMNRPHGVSQLLAKMAAGQAHTILYVLAILCCTKKD